jgi:hypothetical protein
MKFSNDTKVLVDSVMALPVRIEELESEYASCPLSGELEFAFEPEQQEQSQATFLIWVVEKALDLEFKLIPLFLMLKDLNTCWGRVTSSKNRRAETYSIACPTIRTSGLPALLLQVSLFQIIRPNETSATLKPNGR